VEGKMQLLLLLGAGAWWVARGLIRKRLAEQRRQNAGVPDDAVADVPEPLELEAEMASVLAAEDVPFLTVEPPGPGESDRSREPARVEPVARRERADDSPSDTEGPEGAPSRQATPRLKGRDLRNAVIMSEVLRRPGARR